MKLSEGATLFGDTVLEKVILMICCPEERERLRGLYESQGSAEGSIEITFDESGELPKPEKGILYVSDSEDICRRFKGAGIQAAADMHSHNRDCGFTGISYVIDDVWELGEKELDHIYRRICGLPCDILETDRLFLRETTVEDVDRLKELYADPEITRYMEDLFETSEEKEYQHKYIGNIYSYYECGIWSIWLKNGGDSVLIGRMGVEMTDEEGLADMGFMLGKEYQGHGYAAEAGAAVLEYAFSLPGIERVRARVHKENAASSRLCIKLGMSSANGTADDEDTVIYMCSKTE